MIHLLGIETHSGGGTTLRPERTNASKTQTTCQKEKQQSNQLPEKNPKLDVPQKTHRGSLGNFHRYTPTTVPIERILMEIKDKDLLKRPTKAKSGT